MNRPFRLAALSLALLTALPCTAPVALAQSGNDIVVEARDALRKRDRMKLAAARSLVAAENHPLAGWVEYWELGNRLAQAGTEEVEAFYARWSGSYVEDRLRNDWLLELGRRRDWAAFSRDFPRFRMNDDLQVRCYALLVRHLREGAAAPPTLADEVRQTWYRLRAADDGCTHAASRLIADGQGPNRLTTLDAWRKARLAMEQNQPRAVQAAVELAAPDALGRH